MKTAMAGMYVIAVLTALSLVAAIIGKLGAAAAVADVVLAAVLVALAVQIGRARNWARLVAILLSVLGALSAFTLIEPGVAGLYVVLGIVQLLVFIAIVVALVVRPSNDWFRSLP